MTIDTKGYEPPSEINEGDREKLTEKMKDFFKTLATDREEHDINEALPFKQSIFRDTDFESFYFYVCKDLPATDLQGTPDKRFNHDIKQFSDSEYVYKHVWQDYDSVEFEFFLLEAEEAEKLVKNNINEARNVLEKLEEFLQGM